MSDLDTSTEVLNLPGSDQVGREQVWAIPTSGGEVLVVSGRLLGIGSSHKDRHTGHVGRFAAPSDRCARCRWFEPRIFHGREVDDADGVSRYLVHYAGMSIVPGESARLRHEWVSTAFEVVETLTTRRRNPTTGGREAFLTQPAARVLAQASEHDDRLREAYVNRAVM